MKHFKQRDLTDCGACCLGFVASHHQREASLARIRQLVGTGPSGSTALGLVQAASALGLRAKGVKGQASALASVPFPAIAHCLIDGRLPHYVVLLKWTKDHARIMDPASGQAERWTHDRFMANWTGVLILVTRRDDVPALSEQASSWNRLLALVRPHRAELGQACVGALFATVLGLGLSIYVGKIVDHVIPNGSHSLLNLLGAAMVVVLVFRLLLAWFQSFLSMRIAQQIDITLMLAYFTHLQRLPQTFFDTMRIGEITSRLGDAMRIRQFLNTSLVGLVLNPLILVFSLGVMGLYSWKLALLSLALLPVNALIYLVFDSRHATCQRRVMERSAEFNAHFTESLAMQGVIRPFQMESTIAARTESRLVHMLRAIWDAGALGITSQTLTMLTTQAYLLGMLWFGAHQVLTSTLSPGELMSCYALAGYLTGPIAAIVGMSATIREALVASERLFEILDLEREPDSGTIPLTPQHLGDIHLEGVGFRPPGRLPTLHDVTLRIPAGKITALTGPSGGGKSTLLGLVARLQNPTTGRIRIGSHDLRDFSLTSFRRQIATVPQRTELFAGTLLDNMTLGAEAPDLERVTAIVRAVGLYDFIEKLPHRHFTQLGETGATLSGGQRQKLAMARALYRDTPILLLDEPSSALDSEAEDCLANLLKALRDQGRTIVLAAHRNSLVTIADHVVVVEGGRAVPAP